MKTSEMIALLEENPKLRLISEGNHEISGKIIMSCDDRDFLTPEGINSNIRFLSLKRDWELIREPVPVWEAIKALCEGEKVHCELNGHQGYFLPNPNGHINMEELLEGKWYIND